MFGIPFPLLIVLAAAVVAGVFASASAWGSWVYAIGGNEAAARHCGVPVARVQFLLFLASGATAGLCAVLFAAQRNTAKADVGNGIELDVITAVVLGGTSIFGGRGTVAGTILGVLLVHELREFIGWRWGEDEIILIVVGGVLIGSVVLTNFVLRAKD